MKALFHVRRVQLSALAVLLVAGVSLPACDEGSVDVETLRFGQSGEVRLSLTTPAAGGRGERRQVIAWTSDGRWRLFESIAYRGLVGDESGRSERGDPAAYAALISNVNEAQGARLFVDELDPDLEPSCSPDEATLTFTVRDDARSEERSWTRCAEGPLENLVPEGAGPDPAASRVAQAAQWVRNWTVSADGDFRSAYLGSEPFGSLDRGSDSDATLGQPVVIRAEAGADSTFRPPSEWQDFWRAHAGPGVPLPTIDWSEDMVVLGYVGVRDEAGDSVEVRRILPVSDGTLIEVGLRVPGDFCAPASGSHVPFHIVMAPRTAPSIRFSDVRVERVPCAGT